MPILSSGLVNERDLASAVKRAEKALAPVVVRIRYSIGPDWTGDRSIFFRIILSDAVSRPERLLKIAKRVENLKEAKAEELGLQTYFNFRSLSEQAELKEPSWA